MYDNVENEQEENPADHEEKTTPKFVTVSEHKLVNEGETVRYCKVIVMNFSKIVKKAYK